VTLLIIGAIRLGIKRYGGEEKVSETTFNHSPSEAIILTLFIVIWKKHLFNLSRYSLVD